MADEQFTSNRVVDVKAGFDASKLKGKNVLVTGGASGLGEEMVRQFVKAGAFVTIGDLSEERAASIATELGKDNCTYHQTDVLSWPSQLALFNHALAASPTNTLDIVIANAGISGQDSVWQPESDNPDGPTEPDLSILKTNLIGVFYTAKLALHFLSRDRKEGDDKLLVMTASLGGYLDMPGAPQYNSSKWAVRGLMRSLRRTMPDMGMRVNILAPWFVQTRIMSDAVVNLLTRGGVSFAEKADAAKAVLHFSADTSINGRAFAVFPRGDVEEGYRDMCLDDFDAEHPLTEWQVGSGAIRHRIDAK